MRDIRLLTQMFIPGTLIGPFTQANPGLGGVCTFVGEVRYDVDEAHGHIEVYMPFGIRR